MSTDNNNGSTRANFVYETGKKTIVYSKEHLVKPGSNMNYVESLVADYARMYNIDKAGSQYSKDS